MAGWLGHRKPRNIIYYLITVVEDSKDMMKITVHGELNIYFSFHGKFYLPKSRLTAAVWKSRFTRKKLAISHFMGEKKGRSPVTNFVPREYPLPPSLMRHFQTTEWFQ